MVHKIFRGMFIGFLVLQTLGATEYKNNPMLYDKFWNLYNGGFVEEEKPALKKTDLASWSATMKLNNPKVIKEFVGKNLYYITETHGDRVVRLAPSFYVIKDQTWYLVWWSEDKSEKMTRTYITLPGNESGQIIGSITIPDPGQQAFYAQKEGGKAFKVTSTSPVTIKDIRQGLRTDWQHDIPGTFQVGAETRIGKKGKVVFDHFYIGAHRPEPVFTEDQASWFQGLDETTRTVLKKEFGLSGKIAGETIEDFQYILSAAQFAEMKDFFETNKEALSKQDPLLLGNYIPGGLTCRGWTVISTGGAKSAGVHDGVFVIEEKKDPNGWVIVKLPTVTNLTGLVGAVARISFTADIRNYTRGALPWQTVFLEIVQRDGNGAESGAFGKVSVPLSNYYTDARNCRGVFENEFVISSKTTQLDITIKIPGAPEDDQKKQGITFDAMKISKVALTKATGTFDLQKMFAALPDNAVRKSGDTLECPPAEIGILIGDRMLSWNKGDSIRLEYRLGENGTDYSGLYSNIFEVNKIDELEISADMGGHVQRKGTPANWASNTIEIAYYDEQGEPVFPAEYGAERYPKISWDTTLQRQTLKSFFAIPHERGAKYAQIKFHFPRQSMPDGRSDLKNYYTGESYAQSIVIRPAVVFAAPENFASDDGTFYRHMNGSSLTWAVNGPVTIKEDLRAERREVVFENTDGNWSSIKTEIAIPAEATVLKGKMHVVVEDITTGLASWEGFGFFLEADVVDEQGNLFHYSGIPAYQKINGALVRLDRLAKPYNGEIEYYIPLYHEHLKIKKLSWQLALLGKGKVRLVPLTEGKNPEIVTIGLYNSGDVPNTPALWAQYGLYGADKDSFVFQKNYEVTGEKGTAQYDSRESLREHVSGVLRMDISDDQLKKLEIGKSFTAGSLTIKALPSYARVERDYVLEDDVQYVLVKFGLLYSAQAKFNFKPMLLDADGNTFEIPWYRKTANGWMTIPFTDDIFTCAAQEEILIPVRGSFLAKRVRLIFGDNQGDITFRNLDISFITQADVHGSGSNLEVKILPDNTRQIFVQRDSADVASVPVKNVNTGELDPRDLVSLPNEPVKGTMLLGNYPLLFGGAELARHSVQDGSIKYSKGDWADAHGGPVSQVGFTIVGETFNKWFEYRRAERKARQLPWWSGELSPEEKQKLLTSDNDSEYISMFMTVQARQWRSLGINTIRVHQLFSNWSGLDRSDMHLIVKLLKQLQAEGFIIVFDMLPNTDFTGPFFGPSLGKKPYAALLTEPYDLFRATLVLPEVRDEYVKPAMKEIIAVFRANQFWPNSLSYSNETGFTHGFWTIDKHNPNAISHFSAVYYNGYAEYLRLLKQDRVLTTFVRESSQLMQNHIDLVKSQTLLDDAGSIVTMLRAHKRVKDTAAYVYYNLLRDGVINAYPYVSKDLMALRESFKLLAAEPASDMYYQKLDQRVADISATVEKTRAIIAAKQKQNATKLELLLKDQKVKEHIAALCKKLNAYKPGATPAAVDFSYIDTFAPLDEEQQRQVFYTSFILPVAFAEDINQFLKKEAQGKKFTIGLNNDFTKDIGALLGNAYLFVNDPTLELRFNKYTHHPVGGHSMMNNPGSGTVFDEDSDIDFNLKLFTPPAPGAGYPVQLSETNYTYAGDDDSGQGTWAIMDYLRVIASRDHFIGFHIGLNNCDRPIINDYFNFGNRPYQVNALNVVALTAWQKNTDLNSITPSDFFYNRFANTIELKSKKILGIAGTVRQGESLFLTKGGLRFQYTGVRAKTDCTIIAQHLSADEVVVHFFGIERNNRQRNRESNPNLIQNFGQAPIVYEKISGVLTLYCGLSGVARVVGMTPTGKKIPVSSDDYSYANKVLTLDTRKTDKEIISYRIMGK